MGSATLVLSAAWSAGIVLAPLTLIPLPILVAASIATAIAAGLAPSTLLRLVAVGLTAGLIGQARVAATTVDSSADVLAAYAGNVTLRGRIVEAPVMRGGRVEAVLDVESIGGLDEADGLLTIPGSGPRVLLRATFLRAGYGDRIEARGRLSRPRSRPGWPLAEMLAHRRIFWVVDTGGARLLEPAGPSVVRLFGALRGAFEANTRAILPEPHASLVAGIVFGARVGLPADLRSAMSATGTSHLTAVSGANVAIVAGGLVVALTALLGRRSASLLAIGGVWMYTVMVGAPPSALRAATMATFALAAQASGRESDAISGLALAVALLLGWEPGLAFDLGFQLSVVATAGLILLSPSIERWFHGLPRLVRGQLAIAIAAQLSTLPLVVETFQRLSLVSLPANVLAAPTILPIMALGAATAVVGQVPILDAVLGWAAWLTSSVLLAIIQTAASLPGGVLALGRPPVWLPIAWYLVLGCWAAAGSADVQALGLSPKMLRRAAIAGAISIPALIMLGWADRDQRDSVQVTLFDVEPAAALVRTRSGQSVLLTTSAEAKGLVASVTSRLELTEISVDLAVGPDGLRTSVDLLEIGAQDSRAELVALTDQAPPVVLGPGSRIDVDDTIVVHVLDRRLVGGQPVVDLGIVADGVAILLPGPGGAGTSWSDFVPEAVTVAVLPSNAVTWARGLLPRHWLAIVGETARAGAITTSGLPLLDRRAAGAVDLTINDGNVRVEAERCAGGYGCEVELPPPVRRDMVQPVPG